MKTLFNDIKFAEIDKEIEILEENNLIRGTRLFTSGQNPISTVDGKEVLLFSSSNYISISDKVDMEEVLSEIKDYGIGSGGSRLTVGNNYYHELLEDKLSSFFGYDKAILFSTGYTANLGVISSLANRETEIFSDEKNHASIIDGCALSKAKVTVYKHLDMDDLEAKLKASESKRKIIVSDGVFSMDGDILNLPEFCKLGDGYNAISIVDDAHGFGVIGDSGGGIVEHYKNSAKPDVLINTLSKSISVEGGFACSNKLVNKLIFNKARSFIFSTSLSPFVTYASYKALEILENDKTGVEKLQENIEYICEKLNELGITVKYKTAIIPIKIGSEVEALRISHELLKENILVSAIRYPAVPKGEAILRVTVMSDHTKEQIDTLISALKKHIKKTL